MKVNKSEKAEDMEILIRAHVLSRAVVFSDNSKAYVNIHKVVEKHLIENAQTSVVTQSLKWVHVAIRNVKRTSLFAALLR